MVCVDLSDAKMSVRFVSVDTVWVVIVLQLVVLVLDQRAMWAWTLSRRRFEFFLKLHS